MKKVIYLLMMLNVLTSSLILCMEPQKEQKEASVRLSAEEALRASIFGGDDTDYDADADEEEPDLDALPDIDEALGKIKQVLSHGNKEEKAELSAKLAVMIITD